MEEEYKAAISNYNKLLEALREENTMLVNKIKKGRQTQLKDVRLPSLKAILPYVKPSPRGAFLAISGVNLWTKDDPILRYLPTIKTSAPAYISWYEGTVIGNKPYSVEETVDNLFLYAKKEDFEKRVRFLRLIRGKNPLPDYPSSDTNKDTMESLFCSVCIRFGCGIHPYGVPNIAKITETTKCLCKDKSLSLSYNLLSLKDCVGKEIGKYITNDDNGNKRLKKEGVQIKTKKITKAKDMANPKMFYIPCSHESGGKCLVQCDCRKRKTLCEGMCECSNCNNVMFCACKGPCSTLSCPCSEVGRECTEFCACRSKTCQNNNVYKRTTKAVSVRGSPKHGFGLFAEEYIKYDDLVIEYTGELISDKEAERRGNFYELNKCSYLFNLSYEGEECLHSIDAFSVGNQSKYINHSSKYANLKAVVRVCRGQVRVVFFAIKDIRPGEELLFDYKFSDDHKNRHGIVD